MALYFLQTADSLTFMWYLKVAIFEVGNLKALAFLIGVAIIRVDFICVHAMEN